MKAFYIPKNPRNYLPVITNDGCLGYVQAMAVGTIIAYRKSEAIIEFDFTQVHTTHTNVQTSFRGFCSIDEHRIIEHFGNEVWSRR